MIDIYVKTTLAFDVYVFFDGIPLDISADTVTFIAKRKKTDADADAVITKISHTNTSQGVAKFTLTPEDTNVPARNYFYEIKLVSNENVYILESDSMTIRDRVFD